MELKKDWEIKKLGDVCEVINGKNQKAVEDKNGSYPIYGSGGIMGYASEYLCRENTKGSINNPLYVEEKFWNVDTAFGFQSKDNYLPKLLFYFCKSFDFSTHNKGTTIPSLVKSDLLEIPIPVPPLEEQKCIVKILDEKFAQLETIKTNAQTNLQNAKDLFQSQLTKAFSNTTWEKKKFSELFKLSSGDYLNSKSIIKGEYPIYGGNGIIDYHKEYNLTGDNIIIGRVGALCGNVRYISEPIWLTDNAFKLSFIDFNYDYSFITYLLNHINLRNFARQAAQPVISNSSLKDIEIPLPPLPEQKRIVKELDTLSEKVRQLQEIYTKQIANCDELKQALLQKAFEGEL